MTELTIWVAEDMQLPAGSGLGFYGDAGFNAPVAIGQFQGRTFVTDATGSVEGFEANNCKLCSVGSFSGVAGVSGVIVGQVGDGLLLSRLPNYLASMNVRLTTDAAVRTQNCFLYVHDGVSQSHDPSGLVCFAAEIIHPSLLQTEDGGGDMSWQRVQGATPLGLIDTPGTSGLRPDGSLTIDTRHDWYVALSCSPTKPGDRVYGFTIELEYI